MIHKDGKMAKATYTYIDPQTGEQHTFKSSRQDIASVTLCDRIDEGYENVGNKWVSKKSSAEVIAKEAPKWDHLTNWREAQNLTKVA